jgi:hypothetical protein
MTYAYLYFEHDTGSPRAQSSRFGVVCMSQNSHNPNHHLLIDPKPETSFDHNIIIHIEY